MTIKEYANYDGLGLAELVIQGQVTPLELVESCIERIERHNPVLNAIVYRMDDLAREAARGTLPDGPFKGVPFLLKQIEGHYEGVPTTMGSRAFKDFVSPQDSELVTRYKRAGLIAVGKTNVPEFGLISVTEPILYGPARNPWDTDRTPGGSSGGSAAAVAAGIVPFAHGNDGGGSIRIPAACCGLVGLKPTRARNPLGPYWGDFMNGLVCQHVLTRTVRDCAAVLDATSGPDIGDPYWAPPPRGRFMDAVNNDPAQLRIAFSYTSSNGESFHEQSVEAVKKAASMCQELGHVVEEDMPKFDADLLNLSFGVIWSTFAAHVVSLADRQLNIPSTDDYFEPLTLAFAEVGKTVSASEYITAIQSIQLVSRQIAAFFNRFDSWVFPTIAKPPLPIGTIDVRNRDLAGQLPSITEFAPLTPIFNCTGQPAISLPLHWTEGGLPVGVHFGGRFGDEETLLCLASQLQSAFPWSNRHPPRWG